MSTRSELGDMALFKYLLTCSDNALGDFVLSRLDRDNQLRHNLETTLGQAANNLLGLVLATFLREFRRTVGSAHPAAVLKASNVDGDLTEEIVVSKINEEMAQGIVRNYVDEVMVKLGAELEPDSNCAEITAEIMRRKTTFDRHKWTLYFERFGCRRCDRRDEPHQALGLCGDCYAILRRRVHELEREFTREYQDR